MDPLPGAGTMPYRGRLTAAREALASALWPVPVAITVLAVLAGALLPQLDGAVDGSLPGPVSTVLFNGGATEARQLLSAIATGLITTVSLVFSLTVVVFQLASSQYSPRLLRVFPRDGLVRATLGLLVGSFGYALAVMRTIRHDGVPRVAISFCFLLTMVGAVLLVIFLGHLVTELRVETMLRRVHREQDRVERELFGPQDEDWPPAVVDEARPGDDHPAGPGGDRPAGSRAGERLVPAGESGYVTAVDREDLLRACRRHGVAVRLLRTVGEAVTVGTPLAAYRPVPAAADGEGRAPDPGAVAASVRRACVLGYERTSAQDIGYGIQQLVDVYVKALSPGINDPSTAVASLGHLAAVLVGLARRDLSPRLSRDGEGRVLVEVPLPDFARLLEVALGPVRTYGAHDPAVVERTLELLRDVAWTVRDKGRRQAVRAELDRLLAAADEAVGRREDRARLHRVGERVGAALAGQWR